MSNSYNLCFTIDDLGYIFHRDGTIVPCVRFLHPRPMPGAEHCTRFPLDPNYIDGVYDLAKNDHVRLTWTVGERARIDVLERSEETVQTVPVSTCPVCGAPLLTSGYGIGRCVNIECPAQTATTVLTFLSTIGTVFDDVSTWILERILNRSAVLSPLDLYSLKITDLLFTEVSVDYIQSFLSVLHSFRGRVSMRQILSGLPRIIPLSEAEIKRISKPQTGDLHSLWGMYSSLTFRQAYPVHWNRFDAHMSVANNYSVMEALAFTMNN